jgi:hypothetical protein
MKKRKLEVSQMEDGFQLLMPIFFSWLLNALKASDGAGGRPPWLP